VEIGQMRIRNIAAVASATALAFVLTAAAQPDSTEVLPAPKASVAVPAPELASRYSALKRPSAATLANRMTITSTQQLSATITRTTGYTQCSSPDPSDTTGVMRFYVTWLRDTAPTPDKVRPIYFVLQNGFNHTVGVDIINHYPQAGTSNWYTNNSFVLTTPDASGSQQAGNFQNTYNNTEEGVGSLPARPLAQDRTGNKWTVHRPQWNGWQDTYWGNNDPTKVATYSPYNVPWWTNLRNDGPYFLAYYHVQGTYSTCDGWYPA